MCRSISLLVAQAALLGIVRLVHRSKVASKDLE